MIDDPTPDPDRLARIERALAEYLLAADAGTAPDSAAWLAQYPDLQPELGELLHAEAGLRRLADPLRPAPGQTMAPEAATVGSGVHHADQLGTMADHSEAATPSPRPAPGPAVTTDRDDGDTTKAEGDPDATPVPLPGGARVRYFGDYEIRRELGRGGMGVVYEAKQISLNRPVALKMIKAGVLADEAELRRFQNEAEAIAILDHPGIVPVHEVGQHDGQRYFSMKLVPGASLAAHLGRYRDNPRAAALLVAEAAEAVHHAHMRGILHRDLKPANILVDDQGHPHVTDFGLAKKVEGDSELTQSGAILGTPAYMAPEQTTGHRGAVTTATDVYGLGAVLYALLAGQAPFGGDSAIETLDAVRTRPPEPPTRRNPRAPRDLEVICLKCLEKDPHRRYTSARELTADLRRFLAGEPIAARPVRAWERVVMWARRQPVIAGLAASLALATVLGVAGIAWQWRKAEANLTEADLQRGLAEKRADSLDRQLYINRVNLAYRECLANNIVAAERLLDECPVSRRDWECDYTRRLCHVESLTIRNEIEETDDGTADVSRPASAIRRKVKLGPLQSDAAPVNIAMPALAIAPDGKRIASLRGSMVILWDSATGQEVGRLRGSLAYYCIAFRPDGRWLAAGGKGLVTIWDVATGDVVRTLSGHNDFVKSLAFSPDGRRLASSTTTGITARHLPETKVWDVEGGQELATFHIERRWGGQHLAFSPDGRRLALVMPWRRSVILIDAVTGREERSLETPTDNGLNTVAFSPDGRRIAASCKDGTVVLWDAEGMSIVGLFRGHTKSVFAVAFSPDSRRIASASEDNTVRLWDAATGREVATLRGHYAGVYSVQFGPDGTWLASIGSDQTVKVWEMTAAGDSLTLRGYRGYAFRTQFTPDGRLVTSGFGVVSIRDPATGQALRTISMLGGGVWGLAVSPDGRRVAAGHEFLETFDLWDSGDGRNLVTFRGHTSVVSGLAFSPDGRRIASASGDATVRIWDAESGREIRSLPGHPGGAFAVAYSPDGRRLASIGWDSMVRLWDPETGAELRVFREVVQRRSGAYGSAVAFSPEGSRLAAASDDGRVVVWDVETGDLVLTLSGYDAEVNSVAFDPRGRRIASACQDGTVRLWDAVTGEEVFSLRSHVAPVYDVAFSPDGTRIASASVDMTVKIWDSTRPSPEVLRRRRDSNLAEARRDEATRLNGAAWQIAASPDRPAEEYTRAVRDAEAASRLVPGNGEILNTLGVAQYRVGRFSEASETLVRSDALNSASGGGSVPADLAFIAMGHHRLGHRAEAREALGRLRAAMKQSRWMEDRESQGFLREAEILIELDPAFPADPFAP